MTGHFLFDGFPPQSGIALLIMEFCKAKFQSMHGKHIFYFEDISSISGAGRVGKC